MTTYLVDCEMFSKATENVIKLAIAKLLLLINVKSYINEVH